ncbi:hypothetical protein JCM8115_002479 [Rhodotorula mucilaginosa]
MRVPFKVLVAQAALALQVAAVAVAQTSEVVAGSSRTTLFVSPPPPTAAPPQARLQERQFLCHLLGTCRTTAAEEDAPANPKAAATSSASSTTKSISSTSTSTSTSTTSSTVFSTSSSSSSVTSTSSSSTSSSVSSSTTSSSVSSTSSTESSTSTTPSSTSSSSSSATSLSQSVVTVTSIVTGSDGKQSTSVSASSTAVGVPVQNNSSGGGLSGKTWGIIGGVVGGVAALLVGLFVIWRLAKRRSSNRAMDEIAWPELQNDATGGGFSVLNPPGTRQTGGAGFEMEKDREGGGGDYYDDDDEEGEIRNGGWAAAGGAVSPRLGYDPRSSAQYYGSEGGQYGYMPDYGGQPASRNYYDPYHHQEAPLPPLPPPSATLSGRSSPGLVVTSPTTTGGPLTSPQPAQTLPYPGSPIRSSEVADSAYPPRSSRIYSSGAGAGAEDAYGGYAGMSTDDVPLTASAQYPAGAGAGIPYHPGASSPSPLYSPGR